MKIPGKMPPLERPPGIPPGVRPVAPPSAPRIAPPMPPHGVPLPPHGVPPGEAFGVPHGGAPPGLPPHAPPAYPPPGAGAPYGAPPHYAPPPGMPPGEPFPHPAPYPPGPPAAQPPYPGAPYEQPPYGGTAAAPIAPAASPPRTGRSPWIVAILVLGGLLVLGVIVYAVRYVTLSPSVSKIEFAHDFQDNHAVGVTDTFKSTDQNLYAIIHLNTTKGTPNVSVVWTVVNGADAAKRPVTGLEFGQAQEMATNTLLSASVTRGTSPWPVGQYKIDVFLDGKLVKTAQFTVTA